MFKKVLIANRGEIAVRVAATLQQMGVAAVAVYSEPDRRALHVESADFAYPLPGAASRDTYLRGDLLIDVARRAGCDAVHPGYGFLSENDEFAQACADAGLVFIGPTPRAIRDMGDKLTAKKIFADAGVPTVPGWSGDADAPFDLLAREAQRIGYPVLIKAAAGGGGKGMRVVDSEGDLRAALDAARREARAAFADDRVFLEKFIRRGRHVEIQVFGDTRGNVVHLFERECSIQRRHQKIVEESPSPALTPDLRRRMGDAAVRAARAIGYVSAGTVEFLVDDAGNFYFLEVNTRLQVEHPVTETVVGHDLVRAQVLVAAGHPLPFTQEELSQTGHALELRIYAEDPANGFLPSTGVIERCIPPAGPNIRVDAGVREGSEVTVHYDPQLAKLIVAGRSRDESLARARWALDRYVILGITTNIPFLRALLDHPEFRAGRIHTQFLNEQRITVPNADVPDQALFLAAQSVQSVPLDRAAPGDDGHAVARFSPWQSVGPWRTM